MSGLSISAWLVSTLRKAISRKLSSTPASLWSEPPPEAQMQNLETQIARLEQGENINP